MEIEGTYTLQAPTEEVWNSLMDQQTIQQTIPGLESLTRVDERTYTFAINIRHAPLRGSYSGRASVLEPNYPSTYRLDITGEGPTNTFRCECNILLTPHNENTVVSYQGALQLGHSKTLISTPLLKATVRVLLQQFFTALADQLRSEREGLVYVTTLEEMYDSPFMEEQISEQLTAIRSANPPTLLRRLVHGLRLGQRNPALEEQWEKRLRQVGIVAVLLLLVWVGTRLPRRAVIGANSGRSDD